MQRFLLATLGGLIASALLPGLAGLSGVALALAVSGVLTAATAIVFGLATPPGVGHSFAYEPPQIGVLLREPGMAALLTMALLYVTTLTTVLTFAVDAVRSEGATRTQASVMFALISMAAMAARIGFGRIADLRGGTRRRATLRDTGVLATVAALIVFSVWPLGTGAQIASLVLLSVGALGFNGLLYVAAGEIVSARRAGQAVGLASTALFGGGSLAAIPLGALADAYGYRALWPAAALAAAAGAMIAHRLPID